MEIAKLILEFLKVLTWPIVTLIIICLFRPHLERLFRQFSDRLEAAETVKFDLLGQEVQISGTVKELARDRALLAQSKLAEASSSKLQIIDQAARELNDISADITGLKLLESKGPIRIEDLVYAVMTAIGMNRNRSYEHSPMVILGMRKDVERILWALQNLSYAKMVSDSEYELTAEGRQFFERVAERQDEFLTRFNMAKERAHDAH